MSRQCLSVVGGSNYVQHPGVNGCRLGQRLSYVGGVLLLMFNWLKWMSNVVVRVERRQTENKVYEFDGRRRTRELGKEQ